MAKTNYPDVAAYLAAQPRSTQKVLRQVRTAIRKALPDAEEVISYQIPAYKVGGRMALFFAGWSKHYAVYPVTPGVLAKFRDALAKYELAKGTIRFPLDAPVPTRLIASIAKLRAQETLARLKAKPAGKRR